MKETGGSILLVSNFHGCRRMCARKGRRPSLDAAASPQVGREKFDRLITAVRALGVTTETGEFGADMKVQRLTEYKGGKGAGDAGLELAGKMTR